MATQWRAPEDWSEWVEWLSTSLHGRCRWRLPLVISGMLFAKGRRTVTTWLRAVGIRSDFSDYYYFIASLGRNAETFATFLLLLLLRSLPGKRVLLALDDTGRPSVTAPPRYREPGFITIRLLVPPTKNFSTATSG